MKIISTPLKGAVLIELEQKGDQRGFFSRLFCSRIFDNHGLEPKIVQVNDSFSEEKGTLRGLHYQLPPYEETKLVRCISGSIYDVILDLRQDSPTFGRSYGVELSAENRRMLYVPRGFAHGFLTLAPSTEMLYLVSEFYSPECERGIRWNDPYFSIEWPNAPVVISEKDQSRPDFAICEGAGLR
ncbi:MAG: dTDP-4-dehydrorhamnose 3,5-epimerase [Waddliaceae bacterium]